MTKKKRANRSLDMDEALFAALKTKVPSKDTGPEPDDILAGLFEEELTGEEGKQETTVRSQRSAGGLSFHVELDEEGLQRGQQIIEAIREQTGEQIDMVDALRIALFAVSIEREVILKAYHAVGRRDIG